MPAEVNPTYWGIGMEDRGIKGPRKGELGHGDLPGFGSAKGGGNPWIRFWEWLTGTYERANDVKDILPSPTSLDWYDITARNYDPALGRWMNIDPLAELMKRYSSYAYAFDNPIYFVDYDGMIPIGPGNPIGKKIVSNYENSINKAPGGDCFQVCKSRFNTAFKQVMGFSVYDYLSGDSESASEFYNAESTYNNLFASSTGTHAGWKGIPENLRGTGGAGAIVNAGLGEFVNEQGIWNGDLQEGAIIQTYTSEEGFNEVVNGVDGYYEGYGHSFIFLNYEFDEEGNIIGMKIADQGTYWSDRTVEKDEFEVWVGANITTEPRKKAKKVKTSGSRPVIDFNSKDWRDIYKPKYESIEKLDLEDKEGF